MKDTKIQIFSATLSTNFFIRRTNCITLFLLLNFLSFNTTAQDLRDFQHTLKFADYLFKTQQYVLASEEYERAVYYDSTNNTALLKLFQSYRYAEKHDIVAERFNYFFSDSLFTIRNDFAKEYVKNLVMRNKYKKLYSYLDKNTSLSNSDKETYQLGSLLLQKKCALVKISMIYLLVPLAGIYWAWANHHFQKSLDDLMQWRYSQYNNDIYSVLGKPQGESNEIVERAISSGIYKPPCKPFPQCRIEAK